MARHASKVPTDGEMAILQVLWEAGPSTVRQVNQAMSSGKAIGYTTTLKLMQIMLGKGLLERDVSTRPQVYAPAVSRDIAEQQLVGDLLGRVFDGSASQFVLQVLAAKDASPEEMAEIRRMLREFEKGKER